ncbi:MAG: beta-galactosidase [Bacteroidetes bacterium]|nr:beta-galactosidase [Bacteroidota bacterium]
MNARRNFIKQSLAGAWLLTTGDATGVIAGATLPWYRTVTRWGQVNITEKDPQQYDISWWRNYWKQTGTRGVIVNAGGIVAYYPTQVPLHRKAEYLGGRDLFGDICSAAKKDGLAVFARMDSNRAHEEFYRAHPGWFAVDSNGKPYKAADLYIACINSPYYSEHIPAVLKEIATLYHPEGFTDNSWSGLGRDSPCYCEYCRKSFGREIPVTRNWEDKVYKEWIRWNYDRRLEIWDLNNRVTKAAGGADCIWSGMNSGSVSGQSKSFRDFKAIAQRAEIIMLDDQARTDSGGFQHNGEIGKLIHGILGWDKLVPESMAQYQAHKPWFRLASKPEPEARMWMIEGLAGGIQPWWHMISSYHEDRRMHHNPEAVFHWHAANETYLLHREPVATVGVVWSQENMDFYGRDNTEERVELPWRGMTSALIRARIPYIPVHADHIDREAAGLAVLVLPNLAVMSGAQVESVKRFVAKGGSLIATGDTSLFDEWGTQRSDFALAEIFGAHITQPRDPFTKPSVEKMAGEAYHTYLRIGSKRHGILKGFEETEILPFGGLLEPLRVDPGAEVPLTFIPQFPVYPPEKAWMREPRTDIPGLILREAKGARIAFIPADLDRQYGRSNLPDHGNLLRNIVQWAAGDRIPLVVEGAGLIDCHLYRQPGRLTLHLVNLTNENTWRQSLDELITIGPFKVKVKLPAGIAGHNLRRLVAVGTLPATVSNGWCHFEIKSITDHEVIVLS